MLRDESKHKEVTTGKELINELVVQFKNLHLRSDLTMSGYIKLISNELKDKDPNSAKNLFENLISINNEMVEFFEKIETICKTAFQKTTDDFLNFVANSIPAEWARKKMNFDVVATPLAEFTVNDMSKLIQNRELVATMNSANLVVTRLSNGNFQVAELLLNHLETFGLADFCRTYLKQGDISNEDSIAFIKQEAMKIVFLDLIKKKELTLPKTSSDFQQKPGADIETKADEKEATKKGPGLFDKSKKENYESLPLQNPKLRA